MLLCRTANIAKDQISFPEVKKARKYREIRHQDQGPTLRLYYLENLGVALGLLSKKEQYIDFPSVAGTRRLSDEQLAF